MDPVQQALEHPVERPEEGVAKPDGLEAPFLLSWLVMIASSSDV